MKCGLLGQNLSHSYSPQIHKSFGNYPYLLFNIEPQNLAQFLHDGNFNGINITMPYKKSVIPFCSSLSETAAKMGAVNTLIRGNDGSLTGHNTDYFGFRYMLLKSGLKVSGKKVLILGSGGASATAKAVLQEEGADVVVISRSGENNYDNLYLHKDTAVIVNTTPVGMYPNVGVSPVQLSVFPELEGVLDVVYNPARTQLIMDAQSRGVISMSGLWMLIAQAKESAEWFLNQKLDDNIIEEVYDKVNFQMQNLVLIGMPGAGKTTIGKMLAHELGRTFIDIDETIEKESKQSIKQLFAQIGEEGFRNMEHEIIARYGKQSSLVISTGGGCVTRSENYPHLHQNGIIIWIERELNELDISNRPLSLSMNIEEMYQKRRSMYERFADYTVSNNGNLYDSVQQILTRR